MDIFDGGIGAEAVLGEADATVAEVGPDLFVLGAVEAVIGEELGEGWGGVGALGGAGQEGIEKGLDHARQLGLGAAGGGEAVEFGASGGGQLPGVEA